MTVLTLTARYVPPLTVAQTTATGDAAARVAKLLREAVQHERHKATDWRQLVRATIEQIAAECSVPNWDGYGAAAVSHAAIQNAQEFVDLLPANLHEPQVAPDPDGDVSLSWDFGTDRIFTVSVGAEATISYAGILGRGVHRHGQEPFRGDVAKVLVESIREVAWPGPNSG
jgi:hypothetical protein